MWLQLLRKRTSRFKDFYEGDDEIATCLPIIQEVLQGITDERLFRITREAFYAMPMLDSPMTAAVYDHAIELFRAARSVGYTIRKPNDCLIAACAIRAGVPVVHFDYDFEMLARVSVLQVRSALQ